MSKWLVDWWYKQQRDIDLAILWPRLVYQSEGDINVARSAFLLHAFHDPAWMVLRIREINQIVMELEP